MTKPKHIHLIGICGTAMASLAGMLQERGFRVTGSDAAAYPPMSDLSRRARHSRGPALRRRQISIRALISSSSATPSRAATLNSNVSSTTACHFLLCRKFCTMNFSSARMCSWLPEPMAKPPPPPCSPGSSKPLAFSLRSSSAASPKTSAAASDSAMASIYSRRRRIRHRFLRQGSKVPALLSRCRHSHLGRIRSRRHLQRSRRGRNCFQAPREPGSSPRTHHRFRWGAASVFKSARVSTAACRKLSVQSSVTAVPIAPTGKSPT